MLPWVPEISHSTRGAKSSVVALSFHRIKGRVSRGIDTVRIVVVVVLVLHIRTTLLVTSLIELAGDAGTAIVPSCWRPLRTRAHISGGDPVW